MIGPPSTASLHLSHTLKTQCVISGLALMAQAGAKPTLVGPCHGEAEPCLTSGGEAAANR
jgi:hypothetical protein